MIVPPGFTNDSFGPIFAESGEHVQITPAGQMGGGRAINITMNIHGVNDPDVLSKMLARKLKQQGVIV